MQSTVMYNYIAEIKIEIKMNHKNINYKESSFTFLSRKYQYYKNMQLLFISVLEKKFHA